MTRRATLLALAVAWIAVSLQTATPAFAGQAVQNPPPQGQPGPPPGGARGRGAMRGALQMPDPQTMGPGQIDQLFDAMVIFQAQPQLNLTDDQWLVFGQKLKQLQNIRHRLQRQRLDALAGLREQLRAQGALDETAVGERLRIYD